MAEKYDNPSKLDLLRSAFHQKGKVIFLLTPKETSVLKGLMDTDTILDMMNRRVGWKYQFLRKYYVFSGIVKSLAASVFFQRVSDVFDFYAIDKEFIRNIQKNSLPNGLIELTFHKKSS